MAAGAFYFWCTKSNKSAFFFLGFFAAHGLSPANQAEPQAANNCSTLFAHGPPLQQIFAMPFAAAQATIVLPDFMRSELHEKDTELWESGMINKKSCQWQLFLFIIICFLFAHHHLTMSSCRRVFSVFFFQPGWPLQYSLHKVQTAVYLLQSW